MNKLHIFFTPKKMCVYGIVFLLCFTFFSYSIKQGAMKKIDFDTTVKLQDTIDRSKHLRLAALIDDTMEGSTFFASPEVSVVAVLMITGVALYDWRQKKIRWMALVIPFFFFLLVMAEMYGKSVVHHPAPPFFMIKNPTTFFPKYYINDEFSYPSGHAARAVFMGLLIAYFACLADRQGFRIVRKPAWRWIVWVGIFVYITVVSVSRMYLGHHWLSDIIGGILLGSGCALLSGFFLHFRRSIQRD